jgi:LysM repeat protein
MTPTRILAASLLLLLVAACTRSASTPPPGEGGATSEDSQLATMDAVRAALLTQTAEAGGPGATATPFQFVAATETPAPEQPTGVLGTAEEETEDFVEYTVKAGDWLFQIAANFGVDPQAIVDLNGLTAESQIVPGLVLRIPPSSGGPSTPVTGTTVAGGTVHVVKPGEWIWQIARIYGVNPQAIIDANNLTNPALIFPGMELTIP